MEPILSILIPTLRDRKYQLQKLQKNLMAQINAGNYPAKVVTFPNNGESSIGKIRNKMLAKCNTPYLCFFDDDDTPGDTYIRKIMEALQKNPGIDAIGFLVDVFHSGNKLGNARISHEYEDWHTATLPHPYKYCRTINHLAVVKTELAQQAKFPDIGHGEDYEYSKRLKPHLQNCITIPETLYYYYFEPKK